MQYYPQETKRATVYIFKMNYKKQNIYGLEQGYDINFGLGLLQLQLKIWFISWVKDIQ